VCRLESDAITSPQRALLSFARKITQNSQGIAPADIEELRATGWSDLQIAETIHLTALFACFNRVVNAFGLPSQELLAIYERESEDHA
jgi:alkylhydroperoxidase family enzyme